MTLSYEANLILSVVNFGFCCGIGWACVCRLNHMKPGVTRLSYSVTYSLMLCAATASGFTKNLFGDWPSISEVILSAVMFVSLLPSMRDWKWGAPERTMRNPTRSSV